MFIHKANDLLAKNISADPVDHEEEDKGLFCTLRH